MKIRTTAPGKIILLGEYAVLEGAPALVMAVNRFAEVTLEVISSDQCKVSAPAVGIKNLSFKIDSGGKVIFEKSISSTLLKKLSFFMAALEAILSSSKCKPNSLPSFIITLDTSQFFTTENQKLGLGSSAALTVALFSALSNFRDKSVIIGENHDDLLKTSLMIHRLAQGDIGSGIDVAASLLGGMFKYQVTDKNFESLPVYEKLTIPEDLHILFIWTEESASTTQFVRRVNELKMDNPHVYETIIWRMKQVCIAGIEAFMQNNPIKFMKSVELYYDEMKALGEESGAPIVSKIHRQIHDIVLENNSAYKPSGAGGGDIGTAFCNSGSVKEKIANELIRNGFKIIDLKLVSNGVQFRTF